jgi:capsid protein
MRDLRADYGAANSNRFRRARRLPSQGAGADYHIRDQHRYFQLIEFARDMEHNAPLVRQAIRRLVSNCNPGAMTPDPETGDKQLDAHLMRRWKLEACNPRAIHAAGKLSFRRMTNVAFGRCIVDGDIFGLPLDDGRVQTLESDRCRTPNRAKTRGGVCGVEKNSLGEATRFWFTKQPYDGYSSITFDQVEPYAATTEDGEPNVFHVFCPERFSQSRGISALAPVLDVEAIRDDLEFAQLIKNQVQACQTFARKIDSAAWAHLDMLGAFEKLKAEGGEYFLDEWANGNERKTVGVRPGQILNDPVPGISYEMFSSDIPGDGFFQLEKMVLTYLGLNLDLPLIVLLLDASDTTFSSYRHVLDQARQTYAEILDWFSMQWHRPFWRWKVLTWLDQGDAELLRFVNTFGDADEAREKLLNHAWEGRGERYIEPVKDASADAIQLHNSLTSRRRWSRRRHGVDWDTLAR